jgi:hypothetical protein
LQEAINLSCFYIAYFNSTTYYSSICPRSFFFSLAFNPAIFFFSRASEYLVDYFPERMIESALSHPNSLEVFAMSSALDGLSKPAIKAVGETSYYPL